VKKCIDFASTEYHLSCLVTYCWLTYILIYWFLLNILWNSRYFILTGLNVDSCHLLTEHVSLYNFSSRQPFYCTKSSFTEVSLVHCIQQRVSQPQLYNVNELKCAYGMAQWHWQKHYLQCNWWAALESLSISAANNEHYEQLSWQYRHLVSHITWNI